MGMRRKVAPDMPRRPNAEAPAPTAKKIVKAVVSGSSSKNGSSSLKK